MCTHSSVHTHTHTWLKSDSERCQISIEEWILHDVSPSHQALKRPPSTLFCATPRHESQILVSVCAFVYVYATTLVLSHLLPVRARFFFSFVFLCSCVILKRALFSTLCMVVRSSFLFFLFGRGKQALNCSQPVAFVLVSTSVALDLCAKTKKKAHVPSHVARGKTIWKIQQTYANLCVCLCAMKRCWRKDCALLVFLFLLPFPSGAPEQLIWLVGNGCVCVLVGSWRRNWLPCCTVIGYSGFCWLWKHDDWTTCWLGEVCSILIVALISSNDNYCWIRMVFYATSSKKKIFSARVE